MAYLHTDHPVMWEMTHHPVVAVIVAVVLVAAILSMVFGGPALGPSEMVGADQVP